MAAALGFDMVVLGKILTRGQVTVPREIRRAAGIKAGDVVAFEATGPGTVALRRLPRLTLAETFERYRIEAPVDDAADRDAWHDVAARDVIGQRDE
jgi:AbrB family looped-hinge helix DNA binding protein